MAERGERLPVHRHAPRAYRALIALDASVEGIEPALRELVNVRASQMNGCSFCIDLHTTAARRSGEDERRLLLLTAWRETELFTERERAALALTEALTILGGPVAADVAYKSAARHFGPVELANLALRISVINVWNRLGVVSGMIPDGPSLREHRRELGELPQHS